MLKNGTKSVWDEICQNSTWDEICLGRNLSLPYEEMKAKSCMIKAYRGPERANSKCVFAPFLVGNWRKVGYTEFFIMLYVISEKRIIIFIIQTKTIQKLHNE